MAKLSSKIYAYCHNDRDVYLLNALKAKMQELLVEHTIVISKRIAYSLTKGKSSVCVLWDTGEVSIFPQDVVNYVTQQQLKDFL